MVTSRKCLSLSFGIATEKQVLLVIDDLIIQANDILETKLTYDILFHTKLGGKTYGNGYLWVGDERFYSLLNKTIKIGSYELTDKQTESLEKMYHEDIPRYGTVIIDKARYAVESIDEDIYYTNKISATGIPQWINSENTIEMMKKFSSSSRYPTVKIAESKVIVTFDPKTNDAIFALLMNQGREFGNTRIFFVRELKRYGLFELKKYGLLAKKIIEERLVTPYIDDDYLQYESLRIL